MKAKEMMLSAAVVLGLSGCTVYEGYVVKETRSRPERPVEVARAGDIGSFDKVLVAGADLAAAIIAPVAAVAKAVVISVVDVEVNRSKETRTIEFSRWFTTGKSGFPRASAQAAELLGPAALDADGAQASAPPAAESAQAPGAPAEPEAAGTQAGGDANGDAGSRGAGATGPLEANAEGGGDERRSEGD
jgi:hypothetical protein